MRQYSCEGLGTLARNDVLNPGREANEVFYRLHYSSVLEALVLVTSVSASVATVVRMVM